MKNKFLTVREAALHLGVRFSTAYNLLWDGTIPGEKEDGAWRIDPRSVETYKHRRRVFRGDSDRRSSQTRDHAIAAV